MFALRLIHALMQQWNGRLTLDRCSEQHCRIPATSRTPEVFFAHTGTFAPASIWNLNNVYRRELERGYAGMEDLWSPGVVGFTLLPGQPVHFVCSSDPIDLERVLEQADWQCTSAEYVIIPSQVGPTRAILLSAPDPVFETLLANVGQFNVAAPPDGTADKISEKSVICIGEYPWGAPSAARRWSDFPGSFWCPPGLATPDPCWSPLPPWNVGLMPTLYAEDGASPLYHGADVSLWYINAVLSYFRLHERRLHDPQKIA